MKVREITVHDSVPYQKAPYMIGKVELGAVADLDEGECREQATAELFAAINKQAPFVPAALVGAIWPS